MPWEDSAYKACDCLLRYLVCLGGLELSPSFASVEISEHSSIELGVRGAVKASMVG